MLSRREFTGFVPCAICGPTAGYVTLLVEAPIETGVPLGRHTHLGIESAFVARLTDDRTGFRPVRPQRWQHVAGIEP